ncbi:peptidyl-prolyl cis-trans isomerase [soil metagenome]
MLQQIRDRITGWVAGIVLALLAVTFVFWGIDFGTAARDEAATVNGEPLPLTQFRNAYQNRLNEFQQYYQDEIPDPMRRQIRENVLEGLVRNSLLRQRADRAGYRVSDAAVRASIESLPVFQVDGEFSRDLYYSRLRNQGLSPTAFEAEQRELLELGQLQQAIARTAFVTPAEEGRVTQLENEHRELAWAQFPVAAWDEDVTVDEADVEAYYADHQDEFLAPETVTLKYLEIRAQELSEDIEVSEQELTDYYESVADRYVTPEQRRASHVLIEVGGDVSEEQARNTAEQVVQRARDGEDFTALAEEFSDDTGTADAGGDLGWLEPGTFEGPFDDALFSMEEGEIRGPVRSEYGFHVIKLTDLRSGETRTLDEVRAELVAEIKTERAEEKFYERAEALADAAFETPGELESVARELDLELHEAPSFSRTTGGGEIGANTRVIEAAFDESVLVEGENSPILELDEDHAMVVRASDHQPSVVKPLAEVREEIEGMLAQRQARERAAEAGEAFRERVQDGAEPEALAAEMSAEYRPPRLVGRTEPDVPAALLSAAFRAPRPQGGHPSIGGVALASGDFAVYLISDVRPGDAAALPAHELKTRRQELARRRGNGEFTAYVEELRADAEVRVNEDLEDNVDSR